MKIKILTAVAGLNFSFKKGDVVELHDEAEAKRWIAAEIAQSTKDETNTPTPVPQTSVEAPPPPPADDAAGDTEAAAEGPGETAADTGVQTAAQGGTETAAAAAATKRRPAPRKK